MFPLIFEFFLKLKILKYKMRDEMKERPEFKEAAGIVTA